MKSKFCFKYQLVFFSFLFCVSYANAQKSFFVKSPELKDRFKIEKNITSSNIYKINQLGMKQYLANAPLEFTNSNKPLLIAIPLPDGTTENFEIFESPVLSPEIAAKFPDIKTYTGKSQNNSGRNVRISFTANGFDAIITGAGKDAVYFQKLSNNVKDNSFISYFGSKAIHPGKPTSNNKCGALLEKKTDLTTFGETNTTFGTQNLTTSGGTLKTFRLAVAADAEFTTLKGSGNANSSYAALVAYVNRLIAVYRAELSVSFTLVSTTNLVYATVGVPYNNSNQSLMLTQNQTNVDNVIGTANYDLAFVLGTAGGSGGGVAVTPSVGDATAKAQDVSGVGDGTFAAVFDDQLIAHEVGHQFSMTHTFNSSIPVCTTREPTTSVEVGSGTTIMSYGYTCNDNTGNDDYENTYLPLLNFHAVSYSQAVTFLATIPAVGTTSGSTGNTPPVITGITTDKTIPKSTPFFLTGTATDVNAGDVLSYSWEGTNVGTSTPVPATFLDNAAPPFFRSYPPVTTNTRYYPRLSAILDGTNTARGDKLPSVGIVTTHRFTVKDNVDGVNTGTVSVTIDANSGPFLETTNLAGSYASSSTQTITWSVNNTTAAPVSCANVDILLSVDGGQTFPYTLVASTPNTGTQVVTLPSLTTATTTARIKVQASNNIFFDISNNNFSITSAPLPVSLVSLNAYQKNSNIIVEWNVANEVNLNRYEVEKADDGSNFTKVGTLAANNQSKYAWIDVNAKTGSNYYRLKMIDNDGTTKYSAVVSVKIDSEINTFTILNNPVIGNQLSVQFGGANKGTYYIKIYSQIGQLIFSKSINHIGGSATYNVGINNVAKGIYQVSIINATNTLMNKTILVN